MKTALFQTDIIYGAPEWNLDKVSRWIEGLPKDIDLAVLPELFDTGTYKKRSDSTIEEMTRISTENKVATCFTTYTDGHNRFCFIYPDGRMVSYDKRHIYPVCNEKKYIKQGQKRVIIEYMDFRILPEICYDLRFPVWSYNTPEEEYDLAIYLAAWPEKRKNAWYSLLKARAIENSCYVIAVNRIGDDAGNHYMGGSMIIDYSGKQLSHADEDLECTINAVLEIEPLNNFRRNFCNFDKSEKFNINV